MGIRLSEMHVGKEFDILNIPRVGNLTQPPPRYSGTPLIRPPMGHENLVVLTGWSYKRGRVRFHEHSILSGILTDVHNNYNV